MVENKNNGIKDPNESFIDEGWWASVLNDEKIQSDLNTPLPPFANEYDINMSNVDWEYAQQIHQDDSIIQLKVYGYNRGGLLVEGEKIQGFIPISHLTKMATLESEIDRYEALANYIDLTLSLKIIECTPEQKRIVFSERAALAKEGERNHLFSTLKPGDRLIGNVTNITKFGVFVDLGGIEGLIHISELSWGRVQNPGEYVELGQELEVKVLNVNENNGRIALSLKQLKANPWISLSQKYHSGDLTTATITTVTHFGAFAKLSEGIEGLIHVSSLSNYENSNLDHPQVTPGDVVTVKILHIDTDHHRLGLGLIEIE